tara:strand:+ start:5400 stop:5903 length:504 start_codon:yes stop_codon:yes gene_type:complete
MERFAYSVRELVDLVAADDDEGGKLRLLRQVRHWTNENLLFPIGEKHTGTGVARKYGPDEVRKAAILRELVSFGIPVATYEEMGESLDYYTRQSEWKDAISGKDAIFLEMLWTSSRTQVWNVVRHDALLSMMSPKWKPKKVGNFMPDMNFTRAIVLNLNRIFERLKL